MVGRVRRRRDRERRSARSEGDPRRHRVHPRWTCIALHWIAANPPGRCPSVPASLTSRPVPVALLARQFRASRTTAGARRHRGHTARHPGPVANPRRADALELAQTCALKPAVAVNAARLHARGVFEDFDGFDSGGASDCFFLSASAFFACCAAFRFLAARACVCCFFAIVEAP